MRGQEELRKAVTKMRALEEEAKKALAHCQCAHCVFTRTCLAMIEKYDITLSELKENVAAALKSVKNATRPDKLSS